MKSENGKLDSKWREKLDTTELGYIWQNSKQDSYVGMTCRIIKTEAVIFNGWLGWQRCGKRDC
jgi:hypothetical protein